MNSEKGKLSVVCPFLQLNILILKSFKDMEEASLHSGQITYFDLFKIELGLAFFSLTNIDIFFLFLSWVLATSLKVLFSSIKLPP